MRLPNQITMHHGPQMLLARSIFAIDAVAEQRGVKLEISTDLEMVQEINRRHSDSWSPIMPNLLMPEQTFWIIGRDADGEAAVTMGCRRYAIEKGSLSEILADLSFFYATIHPDLDERVELLTVVPDYISGQVAYVGGMWTRPDFRRRGLAAVMTRIVHAICLGVWNTDHAMSLVRPELPEGVLSAYGYRNTAAGFKWHGCEKASRARMRLIWSDKTGLISDLETYLDMAVAELEGNTLATGLRETPDRVDRFPTRPFEAERQQNAVVV
ncbi:hypothetical protein GH722_10320 [Alphaproteobacteria bacterium HT1-32]|nr:hypothetical protein [Alphaproteobacteria bacterium HT1-32]